MNIFAAKFCERKIEFDQIFMFLYSTREGTKAANIKKQINILTKKERFKKLLYLQNQIIYKKNKTLINKKYKVLIEGINKKNQLISRNSFNKIILLDAAKNMIGKFVDVKIVKINKNSFLGKII